MIPASESLDPPQGRDTLSLTDGGRSEIAPAGAGKTIWPWYVTIMTIKLSLPFLPEPAYADFLAARHRYLHSIYFSLFTTPGVDARYRLDPWQGEDLLHYLPLLGDIPQYALINSRFYHPDHYFDKTFQDGLLERLEGLTAAGLLRGVVFADFYLLKALGRRAPSTARVLEAVPSINAHIDNPRKLRICLEMIADSGFRRPQKIILDRALNRRPKALARMVAHIQARCAPMAIGLLANEGCLPDCPFKPAHDAHLALGNMHLVRENTYDLNVDLGCLAALRARPERIFQSPFIRPEDVDRVNPPVSFLKLGGRTLGAAFLQRVVDAYIQRRYHGNLLDLMDTLEALSPVIHVSGEALPEDFHNRMCACPDNCQACGYCQDLARKVVRKLPLQLPDWRQPGCLRRGGDRSPEVALGA
jgi:collagenase-like PrtC family protease